MRFKQLRKQHSWLNFVFLPFLTKFFWSFLDWMQWCFCSFRIYKWNTFFFFSVSKQNLLGLKSSGWNTFDFYFKQVVDSKFHWRSFQSVGQLDSVLVHRAWCLVLCWGPVLKVGFVLEQCPTRFDDICWLEVCFFFLIGLRFLSNVGKLHKFVWNKA